MLIVCVLILSLMLPLVSCGNNNNSAKATEDETRAPKTKENTSATTEKSTSETTATKQPTVENTTDAKTTGNANENNDPILNPTEQKYADACKLIADENYSEAYALLCEIKTYAPAQETLKNFFYAPKMVTEKWKNAGDANFSSDTVTYQYDSKGNIKKAIDEYSTSVFTYDANGNVLTGKDLIWGNYTTYTYQNGKLYQTVVGNKTATYLYNSNGLLRKIEHLKDGTSSYEEVYEYTYHTNGQVKTLLIDESDEFTYNENGTLTKVIEYDDYTLKKVRMIWTMTYGANGLESCTMTFPEWNESATFTYSYDKDGKLTKLEVSCYDDNKLDSLYEYDFSNHQLCYSENPNTHERASIISYTDFYALQEIVC